MRALFVLCGLVLVVDTVFFTAITPLFPYYAARLDMTPAEIGVLAGAYPAGGAAAAIPAGIVATRAGAKRSLLAGLAVMVVTSALFGVATTGWELVLIRFVQGIGSTLSWIAAFAWILACVSRNQRGEAIGHGYGASMIGALLGPAVAPAVPEVGTALTFGVVSVLFAVILVGVVWFPAPPRADVRVRAGLGLLARTPGVVYGLWLLTVQAVLFGALSVLGPLRLDELGFTVAAISSVFLLTGGLAIGVSPLAGRWSDRRGRLEPMQCALAAALVAVAAMPWLSGGPQFALALVIVSLILFVLSAPASALVTDAVDAHELGFALAWAVIVLGWGPGSVVGTVGAGWLVEATADYVAYLIMSALCGMTLGLLLTQKGRRATEGFVDNENAPSAA